MTAGFELLVSADLLVADVLGTSRLLVDGLGLPEPKPSWLHDFPTEKHQVNWLRVHGDRGLAPTAIEVIGAHPETGWAAQLEVAMAAQGDRPMKTHNTVVGVADTEAAIRRLEANGVPHVVDRGEAARPFTRIWVGTTDAEAYTDYDPVHDAGLRVELLPTAVLGVPEVARTESVPRGEAVRVASRSFIVDDIHAALVALESSLGWVPAGDVAESGGVLAASLSGSFPRGAALELLQPVGDAGPVAAYRDTYGTGAYRITLAVNGLDEMATGLTARGVGHRMTGSGASRRLSLDPASLGGFTFDLVDLTD